MNLQKLKVLDGSMLKLIAVITMLIDHSALILLSDTDFATTPLLNLGGKQITLYFILRKIGRLAFPLFCFLVTEGFIHTKNLKRYILNLLVFALISEIPFDLMQSGKFIYFGSQNIYFTLTLGVIALWIIDNINSNFKKFIFLALILAAAIILKVDYGYRGVMLIMLIFVLRNSPAVQAAIGIAYAFGRICGTMRFYTDKYV